MSNRWTYALAVLLPLAATVYYLFARAADQYHSETAFSVRSAEVGPGDAAGLLGALTMVGSGSASDVDVLYDFIRSQEMVEAVDAKLDLRRIYNRAAPRDFVDRVGSCAACHGTSREGQANPHRFLDR